MVRTSRRALLAALGSVAVAGCSALGGGGDATSTATPYGRVTPTARTPPCGQACAEESPPVEGPELLGTAAVPQDAGPPPSPVRERVYGTDATDGVAGLVDTPAGGEAVVYVRGESGFEAPRLWSLDTDGRSTTRRRLRDLPANRVSLSASVADRTVVGGLLGDGEPRGTWLRGYRDGEQTMAFSTGPGGESGRVYAGLAELDGDLVAAGRVRGSVGSDDAVVTRIGADGEARWERRARNKTTASEFWTVAATDDAVFCGGAENNDLWVAVYDSDGRQQWERSLTRGKQAYIVEDVAVGSEGYYALAQTNQFATGDNHLLLVAFASDGTPRWTRVFDPNRDRSTEGPRELYAGGVVAAGGPLVVGSADNRRSWLASVDPEGAVRWAGYHQADDRETRPLGVTTLDGQPVVYGSVGSLNVETPLDPWLAWY